VNASIANVGSFALAQTVNVAALNSSSPKMKRSAKDVGGVGIGRGGNVGGGDRNAAGGGTGKGISNSPAPRMAVVLADPAIDAAKLSPEQETRQVLLAKFHPVVLAVIERLKINAKPGADESKFIREEKAEVQIWLTDKSPETLAKLKQLGFEVILDPKTAKLVIGRLPVGNLQKLAELKFVRYVAPQISN